jgi:shikimate kinase
MGVGKSAIGRRLAQDLSFHFIDTDRYIEEKTGRMVADIFSEEGGENRFRELEVEAVGHVVKQERWVVSTGGGMILNPENRDRLKGWGTVVWLRAKPDVILQRANKKPGKRPLLKGADPLSTIKRLLADREPYYSEMATFSVDTSNQDMDAVVLQIKKRMIEIEGVTDPS